MQVDRRPDDCRICFKPTTSSVSERKKRLALFGYSAEPVRHIIKTYVLESLLIPDFSFEEPHFQAGDYICFSCITLLNSYDKAKKRFHELEQSVRTSLQAAIPTTAQQVFSTSPLSPIGIRRPTPPGGWTSTPKRLRLEAARLPRPSEPTGVSAPVKVCITIIMQSCI